MGSETISDQLPFRPNEFSSQAGAVDRISATQGIIGWVIDIANPMEPLLVELVSGEVVLGSCFTGHSRHDVTSIFGVAANPGFCLSWEQIDAEIIKEVLAIDSDAVFALKVNGVSLKFVAEVESENEGIWFVSNLRRYVSARKIRRLGQQGEPISRSSAQDFNFDLDLSDDELVKLNFDPQYYRTTYSDLEKLSDIDLFEHYRVAGWRERRNPSSSFDANFYLETNPDLLASDFNPFIHFLRYGHAEGRRPIHYMKRRLATAVTDKVSVIIPNYNHARFLPSRLDSILDQSYKNIELIILDDCSTDNSLEVVREHLAKRDAQATIIARQANSGSVFNQWRCGIEAATGSLIWICESDDLAELDFLEKIVPYFNDPSVMVAFGRIQFCNRAGVMQDGLDNYRESSEPGIWSQPCVRTAPEWFKGAFGVANVIANVGGCLLRNQPIEEDVWDAALKYKILGDWYLYLILARGGRIAFEPKAVTYFRQHGHNTSVKSFSTEYYYREHQMIGMELRGRWPVDDSQSLRLFQRTLSQFRHAKADALFNSIDRVFDLHALLATERKQDHILICFVGFHLGGGELFPINLANELVTRGYLVSALIIDSHNPEPSVRALLDKRVAVYEHDLVVEIGPREFLKKAEITFIHSHNVGAEFLFFNDIKEDIKVPYVVTLHGSYEVTDLPELMQLRLLKNVSRWTCLAKNNLRHLQEYPVDPNVVSFIPNGMPVDNKEFPFSRADMGIPEEAIVFTIASRAIPEKGWEVAIQAIQRAQLRTNTPLYLLLAGSGPEADRLEDIYWSDTNIHFLGYQKQVCGIYKLSNCVMLPTRFPGESYPLCLIEAMQVGLPIIATDIGEISRMVIRDKPAGIIVKPAQDDELLIESLIGAILTMTESAQRIIFEEASIEFGKSYDIKNVVSRYEEIYAAARIEPQRRYNSIMSCLEGPALQTESEGKTHAFEHKAKAGNHKQALVEIG